jgi:hypothetical protein
MFKDIHYVAVFIGRDSNAEVRKAKLRVHRLMQDFGMTGTHAARYVARIMIDQSAGCVWG